MDDIEALNDAEEIAVIGEAAGTPAAVEIGTVGRARDGAESDVTAADGYGAGRIARMQRELWWRLGDELGNQLTADPGPASLAFDAGAGAREDVEGSVVEELQPMSLEDAHRGVVNTLELLVRQDLDRAIGIGERAPGGLRQSAGLAPRPPARRSGLAAAAPPRCSGCNLVHGSRPFVLRAGYIPFNPCYCRNLAPSATFGAGPISHPSPYVPDSPALDPRRHQTGGDGLRHHVRAGIAGAGDLVDNRAAAGLRAVAERARRRPAEFHRQPLVAGGRSDGAAADPDLPPPLGLQRGGRAAHAGGHPAGDRHLGGTGRRHVRPRVGRRRHQYRADALCNGLHSQAR